MKEFGKGELDPETERIGAEVVDAGYKVHRIMGAGLLENIYESCLAKEFLKRTIPFERQKNVPAYYGEDLLDERMRVDLSVAGRVIAEVKSVEALMPIHEAQVITYLKLTGCELGFLMNFNTKYFKDGTRRIVLSKK